MDSGLRSGRSVRSSQSVACTLGAIGAFGALLGSLAHVSWVTALALTVALLGAGIVLHPSNSTS